MYPPCKAATRILNAAYFPENAAGFNANQPEDLLPTNGNYTTERVQYTTLVMDEIKVGTATATIDMLADSFKPLDLIKLAGADAGFQNVTFGALLTMTQSWYALSLSEISFTVSLWLRARVLGWPYSTGLAKVAPVRRIRSRKQTSFPMILPTTAQWTRSPKLPPAMRNRDSRRVEALAVPSNSALQPVLLVSSYPLW